MPMLISLELVFILRHERDLVEIWSKVSSLELWRFLSECVLSCSEHCVTNLNVLRVDKHQSFENNYISAANLDLADAH